MKRFFCALLTLTSILYLCIPARATTIYTFDEWAAEAAEDEGSYIIVSCSSAEAQISVPDSLDGKPVTGLAPHAFLNNTTVQSLTFSEPLESIGEYAFLECTALEQVTLPSSLMAIGEAAFSGAVSLQQVNLNKTRITGIEPYTFADTSLSELTLPACCERIADHAFLNCAALNSVMIPRSVTEIGESAFDGCGELTILCEEGSYAASFAEEHGIDYQLVQTYYPYLIGDTDGDGVITIMDATRIQRILARLVKDDTEGAALRGDLDGDGLNILDATAIQRYLVSMGNPYRINELVYG